MWDICDLNTVCHFNISLNTNYGRFFFCFLITQVSLCLSIQVHEHKVSCNMYNLITFTSSEICHIYNAV